MPTALETLEELQDYAYKKDIGIHTEYYQSNCEGCYTIQNGEGMITINRRFINTSDDYCRILAEEIGHAETNTVLPYSDYIDPEFKRWLKRKNEILASRWAIERILPPSRIQEALDDGYRCICAIAEYCGVTEELLEEALIYYGW